MPEKTATRNFQGGVSSEGAVKDALSNILASGISLPGSMLERLITAPQKTPLAMAAGGRRAALRARLIEVRRPTSFRPLE